MAKSVSHPISTRDSNISPRAVGPRADIGRDFAMYYSLFIGESQLSEFVQLLSNCIIYKLNSSHSRYFLHSYRYVTITGGFKFWSTLDTQGHGAVRVLYRATFTVTLGIRLYKWYIRWLITLTRTCCRAFGNWAVTTFLMT